MALRAEGAASSARCEACLHWISSDGVTGACPIDGEVEAHADASLGYVPHERCLGYRGIPEREAGLV